MDSNVHLDYALFQLTPTRTRCDLVVFSGNKNEKLASGLVDPFISHLRCAKEQIPKGGYSIKLCPPSSNSSWFTKGTLERFVRFVSTPEVLERFVTIETEISQIEVSIQTNEASNTSEGTATVADVTAKKAIVPYKPKAESNGSADEVAPGENSKIRLQRVLEIRKKVLRKEQAMAYARAFVAGFDMDWIDDLILFADAFGALRLREACKNFIELCDKKNNDRVWMDELAAVQAFTQPELPYLATSGIILAGDGGLSNGQVDSNGSVDASVSDSTTNHARPDVNQGSATANAQGTMPWPNHPQFMYNFQHPYQGYFPGMQGVPPYYPGNKHWSPNAEESGHESGNRRNRKSSSRRKEKSRNQNISEPSEGEETDPSDSMSGSEEEHEQKQSSTDQSHKKRSGKKSRTIVIRNINYVTSKRKDGDNNDSDESSSAEDGIDGASLKQQVEDAVGSLEKHHKSRRSKKRSGNKNLTNGEADQGPGNEPVANNLEGGNWDSFQNLLFDKLATNEVEKQRSLDVGDEYFAIKSFESGSEVVIGHEIGPESEKRRQQMVPADSFVLNERDSGNERSLYLENYESNGSFRPNSNRRGSANEEMLFSHRIEDPKMNTRNTLADSTADLSVLKTQKGEDWFVGNQTEKATSRDSTQESSIFDGDQALAAQKYERDAFVDDSIMVQTRSFDSQYDSQWRTDMSMDLTVPSQVEMNSPEVSGEKQGVSDKYEPSDLCMMLERDTGVESVRASWTPEIDYQVDMSFTEADKRSSGVEKSDVVEESVPLNNKKQDKPTKKLSSKDIKSKPRVPLWQSKHEVLSRPKKTSTVSRSAVQRSKAEKEEETRKKMEELVIERQKRIAERSAARGLTPTASKPAAVESKSAASQETKRLSLSKPVISSATIERLASPQVKHNKVSSSPSPKSTPPKKESSKVNGVVLTNLSPKISKDENKKLPTSDSFATTEDQKESGHPSSAIIDQENISEQFDCIKVEDHKRETSNITPAHLGDKSVNQPAETNGSITERMECHFESETKNSLNYSAVNFEEVGETNLTLAVSSEISEGEIEQYSADTVVSTTINPDLTHTRKKWSRNESSPPTAKGLKKLLLFGL
ncbi:hypothetical protein MKW94_027794 [Papaver nudicaule]|uniref:COP1-interacting protein 7 n=1 Tax=Papaver nudicaule TaxID=74823 RepID=A0AA41VWZ9_PAPNU|nr:hypothetical protein [Papaver nudicaule]